ncbi:MAG: Gfo/Idh/MocA family oxidoreductase [Chloroflexi bacterium]|nr:Gfo/Idh/MocA family oxidoreductase [Chloroflexota bacterium]MCI0578391.1 Gfo/Idh/MocA family oxidoreductase [Chloroflexota bacterium]MCI0647612.1 Gfo/Idh/MocA family oxidoreductase [Chloroflexota bacterium]MCI0730419.1 Gfo/Idh/MocA family oxidoreductase [Chloroflexota bacterium]
MGRWHAAASRRAGGRLVAVADPDQPAAQRLAGAGHASQAFAGLAEMLAKVELDVLHVCTPTSSHATIVEQALARDLHLLVEKPLAPDAAVTQQLLAGAAARNRLLCPVHQFTFQEGVVRARQRLPVIGRPVQLVAVFRSAGGAGQDPERLDEIVADILPHPLSLIQLFLPGGLGQEHPWQVVCSGPGEFLAISAAGEVTLSIAVTLAGRPTVAAFQVVGSAGTIHLDLYHGYTFVEPGQVSRAHKAIHPFSYAMRRLVAAGGNLAGRTLRRQPAYPGLWQLVSDFYQAVQQNGNPPISPADTLAVAEARDRLLACK